VLSRTNADCTSHADLPSTRLSFNRYRRLSADNRHHRIIIEDKRAAEQSHFDPRHIVGIAHEPVSNAK
jgi:hypothetical protein